jgi:tRNA threonylcarbamoyladenosine biosynthesis protein TsaB
MPKLLAIDTSTDVCSVALTTTTGIQELISEVPRTHTQVLLPMISSILQDNSLSIASLDGIAFGCGPGSFTGLRICLSIAQGLAYGANLPLIPISSLKAMAAGALRMKQCNKGVIVPIIDARMDEVYWSVYELSFSTETGTHHLNLRNDEMVSTPQDCYEAMTSDKHEVICGIGSGWNYSLFLDIPGVNVDKNFSPLAYDIADLALVAYKKGESINPLEAEPIYLRNEISWKKRQRIRKA